MQTASIALGEQRVASADVVVIVDDGAAPIDASRYGDRALHIRSKCDLARSPAAGPALPTSAVTGEGSTS